MFSSSDTKKADTLGSKIIRLSQEELIAVMPYMDRILLNTPVVFHDPQKDSLAKIQFGTDGNQIHTFSYMIIETYMSSLERINRMLFHSLLHCLFCHMYQSKNMDEALWNLSTDIAVESLILDLNLPELQIPQDERRRNFLSDTFPHREYKSAESVYAFLQEHSDICQEVLASAWLFQQDRHDLWYGSKDAKAQETDLKNWESRRKELTHAVGNYENSRGLKTGSFTDRLHLTKTETEDCSDLLRRFMQNEEEIRIDPDAFDYVMYTYGLQRYSDMPLIEPLEYQENEKIYDFVIAVDTSASCSGNKVIAFLKQTRSVLADQVFAKEMNVHILQCDASIQDEVRISSLQEYDQYISDITIKGKGGTDFRPVFERVDEEIRDGTFHHLRGLLYFTDGNGIFPDEAPAYRTAFVLDPSEQQKHTAVPSWAVRIFMNGEME